VNPPPEILIIGLFWLQVDGSSPSYGLIFHTRAVSHRQRVLSENTDYYGNNISRQLKDLDSALLPPRTSTLNLDPVWHHRESDAPAHQWLRQKIMETVNSIIKH
jgi:hypothetical protein